MMMKSSGSALLFSVLILGAVLLTLTMALSRALIYAVQERVVHQNQMLASVAAEGCMEHALNAAGRDLNYTGNETYPIGTVLCSILPITFNGNVWTVKTQTLVGAQTARILVTISSRTPPVIFSWQEVAVFP